MPRTTETRTGRPYTGSLRIDIPPTSGSPTNLTGVPQSVINDLLTPGLVPDIVRQSAEVAAGRGIAGSPAGDSTAVKMSEQNYLQRLGLANSLLSGEAARSLPYQITPYQSILTALQQESLENQREIAKLNAQLKKYGSGGGTGGGQTPAGSKGGPWAGFTNQSFIGQHPVVGPTYGTRPDEAGSLPFQAGWPFQSGGTYSQPTGGGGGQTMNRLDQMLEQLGVFDETGAEGFNWEDLGLGL